MTDENVNSEPVTSETQTSSTPSANKKTSPVILIVVLIVIAALAIGAYFFMKNGNKNNEALTNTSSSSAVESSPSAGESADVLTLNVEGGSFYFKPNEIKVKLGQTVRITLNAVSLQHDFVIDELAVKSTVVPSGESMTVEFTADTLGEFEFYCSVGNHRQMGMVGKLIVEQ